MQIDPIETERLRLVPGTARLTRAAATNRDKLARLLGAEVPVGWPPEILKDEQQRLADHMAEHPDELGWRVWYVVIKDDEGEFDVLAGGVVLQGLPDDEGLVEVEFSMLTAYQGLGYAAEAVSALLESVFERDNVQGAKAHTPADSTAAQSVLESLGFERVGEKDGVAEYRVAP